VKSSDGRRGDHECGRIVPPRLSRCHTTDDRDASRHSLSARHSQELAADVPFNRIDLVLARALAANDPDFGSLGRRRERGDRRESLACGVAAVLEILS
jgi:hypothetical protein